MFDPLKFLKSARAEDGKTDAADFEIVPPRPVVPSPPSPDEVARGDYWSLLERDGHYILEYISGEMYGRLKQLVVTEEEAHQLMRGEVEAEQILIAHGAG